jgi:A/G-specific adenine glycosylase
MTAHHAGAVPTTEADLLALPGVGTYTAAAVATFAFGHRTTVVDTNVRRVLARVVAGEEHAAPSPTRAELTVAAGLVPADATEARTWSVGVMELGALVCSARSPRCTACPVADLCAWQLAGRPAHQGPARKGQAWEGTDRQLRGALLAVLRASDSPVPRSSLESLSDNAVQRERCLDSLVADGLVEPLSRGRFRLPASREAS